QAPCSPQRPVLGRGRPAGVGGRPPGRRGGRGLVFGGDGLGNGQAGPADLVGSGRRSPGASARRGSLGTTGTSCTSGPSPSRCGRRQRRCGRPVSSFAPAFTRGELTLCARGIGPPIRRSCPPATNGVRSGGTTVFPGGQPGREAHPQPRHPSARGGVWPWFR